MTTPAGASRYFDAHNFSNLSSQFSEMYRAYAGRTSQRNKHASGHDWPTDQASVFVLYHALELALKGWIMFCEPGTTEKELRDHHHKLIELADDVTARAEVPSEIKRMLADWRNVIGALKRPLYAYPDLADDGIPTPMPIEPFADFVAEVGFQLRLACEDAA